MHTNASGSPRCTAPSTTPAVSNWSTASAASGLRGTRSPAARSAAWKPAKRSRLSKVSGFPTNCRSRSPCSTIRCSVTACIPPRLSTNTWLRLSWAGRSESATTGIRREIRSSTSSETVPGKMARPSTRPTMSVTAVLFSAPPPPPISSAYPRRQHSSSTPRCTSSTYSGNRRWSSSRSSRTTATPPCDCECQEPCGSHASRASNSSGRK